ncbi:uncharacterized protein LOC125649720 isoform X2 [Ostrea edulis]|nr:uncharacterized protein LOC125649720 isoform X2 [Ostrea edulis]XP_056007176.1 uncharacterized protein LOC125649720 isoform X2 [Ostrea edulis]
MLGRHVIRQCHYGKAHKRGKSKRKAIPDLHYYSKCQRFHIQPSRKVGCDAQIVVRHVFVFRDSQYCAQDIPLRSKKRHKILQDILCRLKNESSPYTGEEKIYVCLPLCASHSNHTVIPETGLSNRINENVKRKIYEIVNMGVTNINVIKKLLKSFVEAEFANKEIKPSKFDRAYYPLSKDIKNHIHTAIAAGKLSSLDQENLRIKIEEWKSDDELGRLFFYRPATKGTGSTDGDKFLYLHQESWQRRLLKLYGITVSLLDATYRTTKYNLPFFILVVRTNVEYIPVADFVTEDETSESIQEALQILKNWNTDWCPAYFMVDYSEAEINSVKAEFASTKVLLCAFHREQAWERWYRSEKNINTDDREEFLQRMRSLAYSSTPDDYKVAEESLRSSPWFHLVQRYIENKWLSVKEYWCTAFS